MKYPKNANSNDGFWISCPHCSMELEMWEKETQPYGKDTECVPTHICSDFNNDAMDGDTMYILEDNFWIRY